MESHYQPYTSDGLAELRAARERFLADREVPAGLPNWLAAAWRRAVFHAVDVDRGEVPAARTPPKPRPALLAAARPVLTRLGETLAGLGVGVVLSDARGRIVDCWADEHIRPHLEAIDTRPGADLAEESTGINALNRVISTGRPALITGPQHLFGLYQDTACAGAPVRDPLTGRVEAAVALVSEIEAPVGLLESLASTATDSIQRELLHQASARERHLFEAYLAARGSGEPVAALDGRTRLVSDAAAALLRPQDLDLLEAHAAEFVGGTHRGLPELTLHEDGLHAAFDAVAGADGDAGVLIRLRAHPPQQPHAAPSRPALLAQAGLVGASPDWIALEHAAARAARAAGALLVHGERGTGKTVAARAVLNPNRADSTLMTVDVCDHPDRSVVRELQDLDDTATLIIRHAERLPDELIHPVSDVVRARSARTAITLITASECDETLAQWRTATATTAELAIPPLRDRGTDIAALVDHAAAQAGLQLAHDAREALRRYTWPGNIAELEHLVAALAEATPTDGGNIAAVAMADLPAHVLTPQRHLTEMEKAERDAVLAALNATGGNKKRAASQLGVSRATLYRKLRIFDID